MLDMRSPNEAGAKIGALVKRADAPGLVKQYR